MLEPIRGAHRGGSIQPSIFLVDEMPFTVHVWIMWLQKCATSNSYFDHDASQEFQNGLFWKTHGGCSQPLIFSVDETPFDVLVWIVRFQKCAISNSYFDHGASRELQNGILLKTYCFQTWSFIHVSMCGWYEWRYHGWCSLLTSVLQTHLQDIVTITHNVIPA